MNNKFSKVLDGMSGSLIMAIAILTSFIPYWRQWGATAEEVESDLPGDEIVPSPRGGFNQAITVGVSRDLVWQWVAQIGQDRGGFYSYDFLENIAGCQIHSANDIIPEFEHTPESEGLKMHPTMPSMPLVKIDKPGTLLFGGEIDPETPVSWLFYLEETEDGVTRLTARWRYGYGSGIVTAIGYRLFLQPIACVMQRRMLIGIKNRAENGEKHN